MTPLQHIEPLLAQIESLRQPKRSGDPLEAQDRVKDMLASSELAALKAKAALCDDLLKALQQFAECNLNDDNCASLELASKRIRNIANAALAHYNAAKEAK